MVVSTSPKTAERPVAKSKSEDRPLLPPPVGAPDAGYFAQVRNFHLRGEATDLPAVGAELRPALLGPFRDPTTLRTDYPLVLERGAPDRSSVSGFPEALEAALAKAGEARILKDNARRLHRMVLDKLPAGGPVAAAPLILEVGEAMVAQLRLAAAHADTLRADLKHLCDALPEDAELLGFGPLTPLYLFAHSAHRARAPRQAEMDGRLDRLIKKLGDLLEIDRRKDDDRRPEKIGIGGGLLDPMALSKVLGQHRGPVKMAPERRARLEEVVGLLRAWRAVTEPRAIVLHDGVLNTADPSCARGCRVEEVESPAEAVVERFDAESSRWLERFKALRIAELEAAGEWDDARHGPWLDSFEWRAFSDDEILMMPPVVAVLSADHVANQGLLPASRALASGRPVKLLAFARPGHDPRDAVGEGYRLELAFFGMGHREAFVHQGTAARPDPLAGSFRRGLAAPRAGLFVISADEDASGAELPVGRWLAASAAIEGRAHPLFAYAPDHGDTWADHVSVEGNPQPENLWPRHSLDVQARNGAPESLELSFTFADYGLLDSSLWPQFRVVPPECPIDDLSPLAQWLEGSDVETAGKVPYIWAVDAQGELHRLVVSRRMAWMCQDRLRAWRMLRELGGVKNAHVEAAVAEQKAAADADKAAALAAAEEAKVAEIADAERRAAREVMERLTAVLLDMDAGPLSPNAKPVARAAGPVAAPSAEAAPAPSSEAAPAEAAPAEAAPAAAEDEEEEPWVDSPLCTSCNDCVNLNGQLFVYDENKQVRIGDPKAGTYAELVTAAEKCPSKCIHPGTPLNPSEAGLEELRKRAKRFE